MENVASVFTRYQRQQLVDHALIHAVKKVDAIIGRKFGNEFGDLAASLLFNDLDLLIEIKVTEDLNSSL